MDEAADEDLGLAVTELTLGPEQFVEHRQYAAAIGRKISAYLIRVYVRESLIFEKSGGSGFAGPYAARKS